MGNFQLLFMKPLNDNSDSQNDSFADEKLTIEQLRLFPGCGHYSNEEANKIIETLHQLAIFLFSNNRSNNNSNETNFIDQTTNE